MHITLAQLEAFYWIARLGSFRDAAKHLHLAQPTVSLRVRDLEGAVGQKLFDRAGRKVQLTIDGRVLLESADGILAIVDQMHERIGAARAVAGVVRLGVPETFALICLPKLLQRLESEHASLRVELDIGPSAALTEDMIAGRIDVALIADPLDDPRLRFVPLGKHRMVWTAAPSLMLPKPVRPSDLRAIQVISGSTPNPQYRAVMDWFRAQGLKPQRHGFCNSVMVIAQLVRAGVGASLLPLSMIREDLERGTLVALGAEPEVPSSVMYVCCMNSDSSANVDAVIRATGEVLRETGFLEKL